MKKAIVKTRLLCPVCKNYTTIIRKKCKQKKDGHHKKLYCYICKETHNFIELNRYYTNKDIEELLKGE